MRADIGPAIPNGLTIMTQQTIPTIAWAGRSMCCCSDQDLPDRGTSWQPGRPGKIKMSSAKTVRIVTTSASPFTQQGQADVHTLLQPSGHLSFQSNQLLQRASRGRLEFILSAGDGGKVMLSPALLSGSFTHDGAIAAAMWERTTQTSAKCSPTPFT